MSTDRYVDVVTYMRAELGRFRGRRPGTILTPGDSPTYDNNRAYLGKVRVDKRAVANVDAMAKNLPKKPPGRS